MGYIREGFASLQHAVSMSYIVLITNKTRDYYPKVEMNRFPAFQHTHDELVNNLITSISLTLLVGFSFPAIVFLIVSITAAFKVLCISF